MYFIAIVLPSDLQSEIIAIQMDISGRYQSSAALKIIPHLTILPPFRLSADKPDMIMQWFLNMPVSIAPFTLALKDFNAFFNPKQPVIYIEPLINPSLFELQKQVAGAFYASFPEMPVKETDSVFKPHLTVAYRDLKPHKFEEAWLEFKNKPYSAKFEVVDIRLLKHDGKCWNIVSDYHLKG